MTTAKKKIGNTGSAADIVASTAVAATVSKSSRPDRVLGARELRVCIWPDYYGISYRDPRTQQLSGMDIDLARD